jgi:two-component system CheB/CheR fusion protein
MSERPIDRFGVVGIGASAGGLQALQHFFEVMPATSGLAFVIVTHLAAEHESHLTELIQPHTTMPVLQVQEAIKIERNHVYVIPPNRNLSTIDSHLRLSPLEEERRDRAPIDHFFRTLADTHGEHAIGIVLSGTGSDGTIGLQRIKEAGGLTLVQEPTEAAYDGMPLSAIAGGQVDLVLPIQAMPARLRDYVTHAPTLTAPDEDAIAEQTALRQILALVRRQTGQDFARYKRSTILRRVLRRVQIHQLPDLSTYVRFLQTNEAEVTALYQNLLISVTNFFRDPGVFARLEQVVIPQLFTGKTPSDQVRVWVAGCATGEEAYSLAILLLEQTSRLDPPIPIQIFATDISEPALLRGRAGLYPETIAADVSAERLARFFSREGGGYRVNQRLRECVLFAPHNLLKDPPFSKLDLITCRNLLIYLNRDTHTQMFELFYYALRPDGYLVLSPAESTERTDLFQAIHQKHSIFQRTTITALTPYLPTMAFSPTSLLPSLGLPLPADKQTISYGALHHRLVERYAPPSALVNAEYLIVHLSEHAGRYLQDPGGEPTQHLLKRVHPELRLELTSALYDALAQQRALRVPPIRLQLAGESCAVGLQVLPVREADLPGYALVIFEEFAVLGESADDALTAPTDETTAITRTNAVNLQLAAELERTKQRLRTTIEEFETNREEMRAGHEELLSINEELKSTTEELETGKEELQSINEELFTTNAELKFRIEELGRANSDLLNLMAATDVGVIFLDRALRVKRFTPPAAALFHLIDSDLERPFAHIAHRLQHRHLPDLAAQVLATQVGMEEIAQSTEGRWYILRIFPYRTVADMVEGVVITFVDISELRRTEEELQRRMQLNDTLEQRVAERSTALTRSNQDLDKFAYVASHDLRSPLRAIDNLATWITEDAAAVLPEPSKIHLDKLRGRIKRMEKLLDDLLAYSRSNRHSYPNEVVDTARLIHDIVALMALPPGFVVTFDEKMPVLTTLRVPLETVLRNLIDNAVKHHDRPTGEVRVTLRDLGDFVEFTITDDGPGIAEQYQTRIFEIFQTLKPRDQVEGSGIGLAIVKKIVESQGGAITVESAEGRGASFRFTWPKQAGA